MAKRFVKSATLFVFLWSLTGAAASVVVQKQSFHTFVGPFSEGTPNRIYSHGDPTNQEQYMLELVNRARSDPANECHLMLTTDDRYIQQGIKVFSIDADRLTAEFASYGPKPPLAFNARLIESARKHSQDMADNNFQGHIGSDGSTLADRLTRVGYDFFLGGENVFSYSYSPWYAHAAFLIDWGVPELGHRINLLNLSAQTAFREIGIGIIPESDPRTAVGPLVITQHFGLSYHQMVFITGVVYRDHNSNNFYDSGEGLSEVTILPDRGEFYAVTSASGGYAIPVLIDSGRYRLKIIRSDLPELTTEVYVEGENIKVDFYLGDPSLASVYGVVTDAFTGRPVQGVAVRLEPVGIVYISDAQGNFVFTDLPASSYQIVAELDGYEFEPNAFLFNLTFNQVFRPRINAHSLQEPEAPSSGGAEMPGLLPGLLGGGCTPSAIGLMMILLAAGWCLGPIGQTRRESKR